MERNWETIFRQSAWLSIKRVKDHVPSLDFQGKRVLDVGCWWGWFIKYARSISAEVTGFDYDPQRVKDAVQFLHGTKELFAARAEQIPLKGNIFDVAFSYHVLEHIEKDNEMIAEIYRILKREGCLLLAVPNDFSLSILPYRPLRWLLQYKSDFLKKHNYFDWIKSIAYNDTMHFREYTPKMLIKILTVNHFRIVKMKHYGLELPYPFKNRLNKRIRTVLSWLLGPITPAFLRSEIFVFAQKDTLKE